MELTSHSLIQFHLMILTGSRQYRADKIAHDKIRSIQLMVYLVPENRTVCINTIFGSILSCSVMAGHQVLH